jgi:hypothetical protein
MPGVRWLFAHSVEGVRRMLIISFRFIAVIMLVLCSLSLIAVAQQPASDVLECKVTLVMNDFDEELILKDLADRVNVRVGFEKIADAPEQKRKVSVSVEKGTVRDVLDAFIKADQRYKWEIADGVINITPKESKEGILDVVIPNFFVADANRDDLSFAVTGTPEVLTRLAKIKAKRSEYLFYMGASKPTTRYSVSLPEMTVKEILNEFLRRDFAWYWNVSRYGEKNEYVSVELWARESR